MTTPTVERNPLRPRRQFTLVGLLSFALALSVYFAMMASVWSVIIACDYGPRRVWPVFATIPTAWCVLWWLYQRWQLPWALRIHYAGPVMGMVILLFGLIDIIPITIARIQSSQESNLTILEDTLQKAALVILGWCGVGVALSLPAATVLLLYLTLWPAPSETS